MHIIIFPTYLLKSKRTYFIRQSRWVVFIASSRQTTIENSIMANNSLIKGLTIVYKDDDDNNDVVMLMQK